MKLVTFSTGAGAPIPAASSGSAGSAGSAASSSTSASPGSARSEPRAGVLVGDAILDLATCFSLVGAPIEHAQTVLAFVENAAEARRGADRVLAMHAEKKLPATHGGAPTAVPAASARLHAPIPRPPSMRDGYAFRQHVETARRNRGLEMIPEFDQFPVFYFTNHQAVIGPGDLHVRKLHLDRLDFELEAAIVVGKSARDLDVANADDAIFGMTIMNDWSARALQMEEMKLSLGPAKGKDFATSLGPYLVTLDELMPHATETQDGLEFDLEMRAFVRGTQVSRGNVKDMTWTFAQILERASYGVTLYPGDVIGSGTCGTGCFLELNGSKITNNQWLLPGDLVTLEVDGLGRLENRVVCDDPL